MKPIDQKVLTAIQDHFAHHPYAPSVQEIADAVKVNSTGYVHDSLRRLKDKGLITWAPGKTRTLNLTDAGRVDG